MAESLLIVGAVLAWGTLVLQAVLLWKDERQSAVITLLFWPAALVVALQRRERWWLGLLMVAGIALGWTGIALE